MAWWGNQYSCYRTLPYSPGKSINILHTVFYRAWQVFILPINILPTAPYRTHQEGQSVSCLPTPTVLTRQSGSIDDSLIVCGHGRSRSTLHHRQCRREIRCLRLRLIGYYSNPDILLLKLSCPHQVPNLQTCNTPPLFPFNATAHAYSLPRLRLPGRSREPTAVQLE